jgi:DNA-binding response OmpR family regulator
MRILVVEDDPAIASFLVKGLKEAGFAVDHAGNGGAALEMASREPDDLAPLGDGRERALCRLLPSSGRPGGGR